MRPISAVVLLAPLLLALAGCTPESLEGLEGTANVTTNNSNNATTNNATTNNGGGPTFTPEFLAVHAIMVEDEKCAIAGCHGPNSAGGAFLVPTGKNASPAELQAALTDKVSVTSGDLLIDPGSSATSDIYTRLLGTSGPLMPTTGSLPNNEIETIKAWIDGGAIYTQ